jgi:hypothetical protein
MTPLVGEMTLGLWLGLAAAIVFLAVLPTLAVFALYYAAFEDEDKHVADVQRFIALRAEARRRPDGGSDERDRTFPGEARRGAPRALAAERPEPGRDSADSCRGGSSRAASGP